MESNSFEPFEAKMRSAQLPDAAIDHFRHYYRQLESGASGVLSSADIEPIESLPSSAGFGVHWDAGVRALEKTVVVKLNGGLGTSMGMTKAKSLLPVKDGLHFLDITARQLLKMRAAYARELPLVLMNSFRTRADSLAALAPYPGLSGVLPPDFLQNKVPKILAEDLSVATWPENPEHEWCPPGHGDIYTALVTSGMLEAMLAAGFEYAFISNSDNLGAFLDIPILGSFASEKAPFLMEATERTQADSKGGHLARLKKGGLTLREIAQCPQDELDSFQNVRLFKYFNTNTIWVNLPALDQILKDRKGNLGLPMIRNVKTIDPADEASPLVYQLESAMGAALSVFPGATAILVPRERFIPVKTTNDLLGLWSDAYDFSDDGRILPAKGRTGDLLVDLDPRHFRRIDQLKKRFPKGAPSLVQCTRLSIRGDFRFGRDVVFRGEVELVNAGERARTIPDGEVFA